MSKSLYEFGLRVSLFALPLDTPVVIIKGGGLQLHLNPQRSKKKTYIFPFISSLLYLSCFYPSSLNSQYGCIYRSWRGSLACLGVGVMKLKSHTNSHPHSVPRSCQVLNVTRLYTYTQKPRATGSNEDTSQERGYHNKPGSLSVCVIGLHTHTSATLSLSSEKPLKQ